MYDSDTFMEILEEGELKRAKKDILLMGQIRFGPPDEATRLTIDTIENLDRLERMLPRVLAVASWQELLDTP